MTNTFTAVYQKRGETYIGYVEELPGANTQGDTLAEARNNLKEAVELILLSNRQLAEMQLGDTLVEREELLVSVRNAKTQYVISNRKVVSSCAKAETTRYTITLSITRLVLYLAITK